MKTEKELNELKEEYKELNKKLGELSEEELKQVAGGTDFVSKNQNNSLSSIPDFKLDVQDIEFPISVGQGA